MDSFSLKLVFAVLIFFGCLGFFVLKIDPLTVGFFGISVFLLLVFLLLSFLGILFFYFLRRKMISGKAKTISVREGIFFSLALTAILYLNSQGLLWVWDSAFIILAFICLEIFLLSKKGRFV